MSVSHAAVSTVTSADEEPSDELPGLLQVLAQVPDPRRRRGKRYLLVFVLAVAVACTLAAGHGSRYAATPVYMHWFAPSPKTCGPHDNAAQAAAACRPHAD